MTDSTGASPIYRFGGVPADRPPADLLKLILGMPDQLIQPESFVSWSDDEIARLREECAKELNRSLAWSRNSTYSGKIRAVDLKLGEAITRRKS